MIGGVLMIVPAADVRPDEPRWWMGAAPTGDHVRMAAVRDGRYTLHTIVTAAQFASDCGVPLASVRAIVRREVA